MAADIDSLTWMSAATKEAALAKLKGVTNKIGYPEKWKTYDTVFVNDNLVADVRSREFGVHRNTEKIGKPVDRAEFGMTPSTVNAYYSPLQNNINFPAGILQPPFYSQTPTWPLTSAVLAPSSGTTSPMGLTMRVPFDADGDLRDWWTASDKQEPKKRKDCIADEYSASAPWKA